MVKRAVRATSRIDPTKGEQLRSVTLKRIDLMIALVLMGGWQSACSDPPHTDRLARPSGCDDEYAAAPTEPGILSTRPLILNIDEGRKAFRDAFSELDSVPGSRAYVLIDTAGTVRNVLLTRSTGSSVADSLVVDVGRSIRYRPGQYRGEARCVWMNVPFPGTVDVR